MQIPGVSPEFFVESIPKIIHSENRLSGDINIVFCSDEYLLDINKKYLSHDYYTDVITFEYAENERVSGDVFVSIDRILENSTELKTNVVEELCRVVFHGVLHLLGYNDKTKEEKEEMSSKENEYLKTFVSRETK